MPVQLIDWNRFWVPNDEAPDVDADGFLEEPFYLNRGNLLVHLRNRSALATGDLDDIPCLVLLGEPGIGKSTELERAVAHAEANGQRLHHVKLGSIGSEYGFDKRLLEHPNVQGWREHATPLTLFLDAFDEGILRIENAAAILRERLFDNLPPPKTDRAHFTHALKLRITCRPDEWPESLTRAFEDVWGKDSVRVLHLAPLRRSDIAQATQARSVDPDGFFQAVRDGDAGPLAAVPLTLFALLDAFADNGTLPRSKADLYERATLLLSDETNKDRRTTGRTGTLDAEYRRVVTARVAALMRFGAKSELDLQPAHYIGTDPRGPDVLTAEAAGGQDRAPHGGSVVVGAHELRDTCRHSGLLTVSESGKVRWVHQAYADFLAAWYLCHRKATTLQVWSLLTDPNTDRVVPQLRAVAVWTATLIPGIFDRMLERDPLLIVAGDAQALTDAQRETAVEAVLTAYHTGYLDEFHDGLRSYRPLRHPALSEQLRRWIMDPEKSEDARSVAVRIASHNELDERATDLATLALDGSSLLDLRVTAVYALYHLDAKEALASLRPLALKADDSDPEARLLYAVRGVLWPDALTFADLLASLQADKTYLKGDNYGRTWADDVFEHEHLSSEQIDDALAWLEQGRGEDLPDLAASILAAALRRLDTPGVAERIAPTLVELTGKYEQDRFPYNAWQRVTDVARTLDQEKYPLQRAVAEILAARPDDDRARYTFVHDLELFSREDAPWMVEACQTTPPGPLRTFYLHHVRLFVLRWEQRPASVLEGAYDALMKAKGKVPELDALARDAFDAWNLDSDLAREAKEHHRRWKREEPTWPLLDPPLDDRVNDHLPDALKGDEDAFKHLCYTLTLRPDDGRHREPGDDIHDVTELAGWKALSEDHHHQLLQAAEAYLYRVHPDEDDWKTRDKGEMTYRILNAVKAFFLVHRFRTEALDALPDDVWAAWAPALVLHPTTGDQEEYQVYEDLVQRAVRAAPEAMRAALARALPFLRVGTRALVRALGTVPDPETDDLLLRAAEQDVLETYDATFVLEELLRRKVPGAFDAVARRVEAATGEHERSTEALRLADADPGGAWAVWGDRFTCDDAFARALLRAVAYRHPHPITRQNTSVEALLTLERRLHTLFPPENDPPRPKGMFSPSSADNIRDLRGGFANALAAFGTPEAIAALHTLQEEQPDRNSDWSLRVADEQALVNAFQPVPPYDLLALLDRAEGRLIRNAEELFAVTVEALEDFQTWLHTGGAVYDLWNAVPRSEALRLAESVAREEGREDLASALNALRSAKRKEPVRHFPKDENHLADLALRFLHQRLGPQGIVINREVEVQKGHATDLFVSVSAEDEEGKEEIAGVVIEVKASWHNHLYAAMETQLALGYLDGHTRRHGVYLVGWYGGDRWFRLVPDHPHPKATRARRGGTALLRRRLEEQAATLSVSDRTLAAVVVDASLPPPRASG